jgi:hypothetical protein
MPEKPPGGPPPLPEGRIIGDLEASLRPPEPGGEEPGELGGLERARAGVERLQETAARARGSWQRVKDFVHESRDLASAVVNLSTAGAVVVSMVMGAKNLDVADQQLQTSMGLAAALNSQEEAPDPELQEVLEQLRLSAAVNAGESAILGSFTPPTELSVEAPPDPAAEQPVDGDAVADAVEGGKAIARAGAGISADAAGLLGGGAVTEALEQVGGEAIADALEQVGGEAVGALSEMLEEALGEEEPEVEPPDPGAPQRAEITILSLVNEPLIGRVRGQVSDGGYALCQLPGDCDPGLDEACQCMNPIQLNFTLDPLRERVLALPLALRVEEGGFCPETVRVDYVVELKDGGGGFEEFSKHQVEFHRVDPEGSCRGAESYQSRSGVASWEGSPASWAPGGSEEGDAGEEGGKGEAAEGGEGDEGEGEALANSEEEASQ